MVQMSGALSFVYATNVADKSTHMSNGLESASRVPGNGAFANCGSFGNVFLFVYLFFYYFYRPIFTQTFSLISCCSLVCVCGNKILNVNSIVPKSGR